MGITRWIQTKKVWIHPVRKKLKWEPGKIMCLQPDNLGTSTEMTIGALCDEPDGPPTSLGAMETERHRQPPDNTAVGRPRRSA